MGGALFDVHTDVDWTVPAIGRWLWCAGLQITRNDPAFAWSAVESVVMKPGKILSITLKAG